MGKTNHNGTVPLNLSTPSTASTSSTRPTISPVTTTTARTTTRVSPNNGHSTTNANNTSTTTNGPTIANGANSHRGQGSPEENVGRSTYNLRRRRNDVARRPRPRRTATRGTVNALREEIARLRLIRLSLEFQNLALRTLINILNGNNP